MTHSVTGRLPPLNALRAFEAAARHRSFTKAAAELCLTQSAVSRHVRNLEDLFGLPLFRRNHRAVTLTPEGQMYMRDTSVLNPPLPNTGETHDGFNG